MVVMAVVVAVAAVPALSFAATYAYVNHAGEIRTVIANTAEAALATAPGLHIHSGVLLLDSPEDNKILTQ